MKHEFEGQQPPLFSSTKIPGIFKDYRGRPFGHIKKPDSPPPPVEDDTPSYQKQREIAPFTVKPCLEGEEHTSDATPILSIQHMAEKY